jgi:uncharacterized membrane protein YraQ (UPF0718 family)
MNRSDTLDAPSWPSRLAAGWRRIDPVLAALALLALALTAAAPDQLVRTAGFVATSAWQIAPVLLLSVGLAAWVQASGASLLIKRALAGRGGRALAVAAVAGALSPLCSCGVVPLIAGLLAAGVPLAPVMAFWLASPIMDPAMFVLTAGVLGLEFAVVKTLAALAMGMLGGWAVRWLAGRDAPGMGLADALASPLREMSRGRERADALAAALRDDAVVWRFWRDPARRRRFAVDARRNGWMLARVLLLAFALESLMLAWIPASAIADRLGGSGVAAVPWAVLVGVPAYLNGAAAVPLVDGLIDLGMSPAVGLAFLVAGGVTSLPAATAVWALVRPRVFALYVALALAGSMLVGWLASAWFVLSA